MVTISGNFGFAHTLKRHCQRAYPAIRLTLIAAIDVPGVAGESAFDGAGDPRENTNVLSGLAGATAAAQLLNEFEVRYLIVGGYAIMKYSEPHYTKDLDVWVDNSAENSPRVFEVLKSSALLYNPMGLLRRHSPKTN